jgi:triacylglycerol lipase
MGGLDCRYLASNLHDHTFRILSISTISTPHRGSSFADHFLETVGPERFPSFLSFLDMLPNGGGDGSAFSCLTLQAMREFNEQTPDVPEVKYFSWGAVYNPGLIDTWKWPHSVILEKEGPNDGLVSVESAKWGTYVGTVEDVSHLDLVGWINAARYSWAKFRGRNIAFHPATFYLSIADHLAREVDGVQPGPEPIDEDPWDASSE